MPHRSGADPEPGAVELTVSVGDAVGTVDLPADELLLVTEQATSDAEAVPVGLFAKRAAILALAEGGFSVAGSVGDVSKALDGHISGLPVDVRNSVLGAYARLHGQMVCDGWAGVLGFALFATAVAEGKFDGEIDAMK